MEITLPALTQPRVAEARCRAPPAPHKPAEEYRLPDKFDDMSKVDCEGNWTGEGTAEGHLNPAWTQETARLTAMSRAITGGEGEIVMTFPAYLLAPEPGVVLVSSFLPCG